LYSLNSSPVFFCHELKNLRIYNKNVYLPKDIKKASNCYRRFRLTWATCKKGFSANKNAPFNIGINKVYEGIPGNLFAYARRLSWDNGNQGLVSFVSKLSLVNHYETSLGAIHVGGFA
jgi:hypothetical protein